MISQVHGKGTPLQSCLLLQTRGRVKKHLLSDSLAVYAAFVNMHVLETCLYRTENNRKPLNVLVDAAIGSHDQLFVCALSLSTRSSSHKPGAILDSSATNTKFQLARLRWLLMALFPFSNDDQNHLWHLVIWPTGSSLYISKHK
jgi:hypothetical protein